jgi:hypothetical protein
MMMMRSVLLRRRRAIYSIGSAFAALAMSGVQMIPEAQAADRAFAMDAMPLRSALERYAAVTGRQLLYPSELVAGLFAPALFGHLSEDAALGLLLAHSGLRARRAQTNAWIIERRQSTIDPRAAVGPEVKRRRTQQSKPASPYPAVQARIAGFSYSS